MILYEDHKLQMYQGKQYKKQRTRLSSYGGKLNTINKSAVH